MQGLRLGVKSVPPAGLGDDEDMSLHHHHSWHEAIPPDEEQQFQNIRHKRLTIDVLLPGPATLDQIRAVVSDNGKVLHFAYKPPTTHLSSDCTAVCLTGETFGNGAIGAATETISAALRVQAHRNDLETVRVEQQEKIRHINLPFECD